MGGWSEATSKAGKRLKIVTGSLQPPMDCTGRMRHILPNLPIDRAANRLRHWARRWLPSLTVDPVLVCRRHAFAWGKGWQERLRKDVACLAALLIDGDHGGRDALLCEHGVDLDLFDARHERCKWVYGVV